MGRLEQVGPEIERRWNAAPDAEQLDAAAQAWALGSAKDALSNRQFLDQFTVQLVKHFRAEEIHLQQLAGSDLAWHRQEHRRLVRQAWGLMNQDLLGLDLTDGIHRLLEAWGLHQVTASLRRRSPSSAGH